ncbi:MAG: YhdP family protein [Colwellia sp.]|nr:YhdP family protein [Colwellia sp.]MCW8864975.1 YhdP family protein [Colwellia sp.]MCW9081727.1 YhdP family protein [Colwellia sp.]
MSITSVSNRWLNRLYKTLAILLVVFAVLISAFRLFLPYVEHYREDFQDYINDTNQTNIVIGSLGMSWQRWGPTIVSKQVTLVDNEDAHIYIQHLEMQVDFLATITQQRLVSSNLILDGAKVSINQGLWSTAESAEPKVAETTTDNDVSDFEQISTIFLNRLNQFSVRNSHIIITNQKLERNFHVNNLNWTNRGNRHQAQGNIIVDELSSNNLALKIDLLGDSFDELKGLMYVEANHLDITPWLDSVLALDNDKTKTDIGFATWLKVKQGKVERVQVELHDNHINWQDKGVQHALTLSAGQLLMVKGKQPGSFKMYSTPLVMQFNQQDKQEYIVQMNKSATGFSVYLSAFDLALISQVSPLVITEQNTRNLFSQLNVVGEAHDIYLKKSADNIQALANFTQVSTQFSQGIPGVKNLSGQLSFTENNLHLDISAKQGELDFNELFVAPIVYHSLAADVNLSFFNQKPAKQGWQLEVNNIAVNSPELTMSADLAINAQQGHEMTMALLASITEGDATKAGNYFPLTSMSADLVNYLNTAIVSGRVNQAQVLINGPLSHFPFTDNSGIFVVDAELEQGVFSFDNEWPAITDFAANLNFTNNSMLITGRSGSLVGLDVNGVQAAIDDLANEQVLTVDTLVKPSAANLVADLMDKSPLKDSVSAVLEQLQVDGNIQGEFHLNLPLNATEQVLASGKINFSDNQVALQTPRMDFAKVKGQLSFANDKISTENLSLTWLDMPLNLDITGEDKVEYYDTDIAITANWQEKSWQQHVAPLLKKYLSGEVQWQGEISLHQHHSGGFSYDFTIDSDLAQTLFHLPAPYEKAQGQKVPLTVKVNGQLDESTINANYGEQLSFFGVLEHDTSHFERAHLVLGDEKMLLPTGGFHITTTLAYADFSYWQPLITDIIDSVNNDSANEQAATQNNSSPSLFSKPERIRGTLTELDILGQQLNNVSFNLLDKEHWWLLQLNAKETRSRIKFFPDWLSQGIDVEADFINFSTGKEVNASTEHVADTSVKARINEQDVFANIPKINLRCDSCKVDKLDLGEVKISLSRTEENIITIDHFSAKREQVEFSLVGQWKKDAKGSNTDIHGNLALKNIEYELEQLGYGSIIRDSGGKLDFDLNWQGGPHEFAAERLNGDVSAKIDDGYLAEVSDKARIFSVLSLDSLVRKLTLDFRDIFSDGMFYSDIKGGYHIKDGVLYTDDTRMNGPAGNLYIQGNTNFVTNVLDYKMSYKPNLTSSLPVLAWIATLNPVVFLAGVAIDQVITSKVVSEFNFELTGNIDDPNFREVNRKSRDISVGRSTPPEFVDNNSEDKSNKDNNSNSDKNNGIKPQSLKQYKPINYVNDLPNELNNG